MTACYTISLSSRTRTDNPESPRLVLYQIELYPDLTEGPSGVEPELLVGSTMLSLLGRGVNLGAFAPPWRVVRNRSSIGPVSDRFVAHSPAKAGKIRAFEVQCGNDDGSRTRYPLLQMQLLYQVSYV